MAKSADYLGTCEISNGSSGGGFVSEAPSARRLERASVGGSGALTKTERVLPFVCLVME
jgi:hypothetical protein